ncbi:MAG: FmdB family zinc ribbon protein [Candidatus Omnitrophota bacterium]|jgi:putative FmdB family regulatory protein
MPHYDYECQKCKHVFEIYQSMTAGHLKKCPKCKGPLKRLIGGGAGIIFKGSGFYETDYKRKSGPQPVPQPMAKPCEKAASSCPANCKHKH